MDYSMEVAPDQYDRNPGLYPDALITARLEWAPAVPSSAGVLTQPLDEHVYYVHLYRATAYLLGLDPDTVLRRLAWRALPWYVRLWRIVTR